MLRCTSAKDSSSEDDLHLQGLYTYILYTRPGHKPVRQ